MFFYFRRRRRTPVRSPEIERMRAEAHRILPPRLQALAQEHGFSYHQLRIKHNLSNWGSCSAKGNINLNLHLVRLPAELQDFVMLHELCHLREMNHGPQFHALLESVCPNHRECARALREYKLY